MAINTVPLAQPSASQPTPSQPSARERAIAILSGANKGAQVDSTPPEVLMAQAASNTSDAPSSGQSDTSESPQPPKSAAPEVGSEKALSPQYAALARKEKALRAQVQQLNAEKQAFKAQQDALTAKATQDTSNYIPKDRLAKDTWAVLNELGITYDKLTESALSPPSQQDQELAQLKAEIQALKDANKATNDNFQNQQTNAYKQAVEQIRVDTRDLVKSNPEFETIRETNSVNDVVQLIERTYKEDGVLLTIEQAAKEVEDYLVDEAMKIAKITKIQKRLAGNKPAAPAQKPVGSQPSQPQLKTLTNTISSTRPISARDRAIMAFKGESPKS